MALVTTKDMSELIRQREKKNQAIGIVNGRIVAEYLEKALLQKRGPEKII